MQMVWKWQPQQLNGGFQGPGDDVGRQLQKENSPRAQIIFTLQLLESGLREPDPGEPGGAFQPGSLLGGGNLSNGRYRPGGGSPEMGIEQSHISKYPLRTVHTSQHGYHRRAS